MMSDNAKTKSDTAATNGIDNTASKAPTPAQLSGRPKSCEGETTMTGEKPSEDVGLVRGVVHI